MSVPVKGTVISSSPCSLKEASKFLQRFLSSEVLPEEGLLRGYLSSVANAIEQGVTRRRVSNQRFQAYEQQGVVKQQESRGSNVRAEEFKVETAMNGVKKESHSSHSKRKITDADERQIDSGSSRKSKKKKKERAG